MAPSNQRRVFKPMFDQSPYGRVAHRIHEESYASSTGRAVEVAMELQVETLVRVTSEQRGKATRSIGFGTQLKGRNPCIRLLGFTREQTTARLRARTAPLLEEERNPVSCAYVPQTSCPVGMHGSRPGTTFATDNRPRNVKHIDLIDRPKERLERYEAGVRVDVSQMGDTTDVRCVFDRDTQPDVSRYALPTVARPNVVAHE